MAEVPDFKNYIRRLSADGGDFTTHRVSFQLVSNEAERDAFVEAGSLLSGGDGSVSAGDMFQVVDGNLYVLIEWRTYDDGQDTSVLTRYFVNLLGNQEVILDG